MKNVKLTFGQMVLTCTFHSDGFTLVNKGQANEIKSNAHRNHKMSTFVPGLIIHQDCTKDQRRHMYEGTNPLNGSFIVLLHLSPSISDMAVSAQPCEITPKLLFLCNPEDKRGLVSVGFDRDAQRHFNICASSRQRDITQRNGNKAKRPPLAPSLSL